jgi:putative phosphoesterase
MRIAVVSDVHGNLTALEAVLADLAEVRPDLVVQGGDVAFGGPHPAVVVDRIRELGWPSVLGNTDVVLAGDDAIPEASRAFIGPTAARCRELLGPERVAWLTSRPLEWRGEGVSLAHSVRDDCWTIVPHDAPDDALRAAYAAPGVAVAVYGHIHHAYVRRLGDLTVVNAGSVSMALDGDPRATYAVLEDGRVEHRRVAYDVERVAADLLAMDHPRAAMYGDWLRTGALPPPSAG